VRWLLTPVAVMAGMLMVVQAACNGMLEKALDRPVTVAVLSLSVGISVLLIGGLVLGKLEFPSGKIAQVPWWAWFGGACGAISLLSQPLAAPRLGAAMFIGLFVTASSVASIVVDHFGWLGFEQHPANLGRIIGGLLMVIGIALVSFF
jgi:bacterial/archaeal transporter family-2 protein